MPPKVSIIILNRNGLKDTIECIESLKRITYQDYEVIVVDNGSKGNDPDVLEERYGGYIRLIRNKGNLGFAEGNNVAIREVIKEGKSEYILTLNNDTTVEPNFLDELVKCAQKYPKAGSIQPKMILAKWPQYIDSVGLELSKTGFGFNKGAYQTPSLFNKEEEILGPCAGAALYKVEALKDVMIDDEIFDKDFFAYYEDFDLALRLRWTGWESFYCHNSIVYHKRGATGGIRSKFTAYYGTRNQNWNLFKNFPIKFILKNFHLIILAQIAQVGINLLKGRFFLLPSIIKGRLDGYLRLRKILAKKRKIKKRVNFSEIEKFLIAKWRIKIPKELDKIFNNENNFNF
ncbi:MAG: glycosyltransferase family 2 protein [Patescibacteria group bacterium]